MPATHKATSETTEENRKNHPVVRHLQVQVANAFVLYANYKHYHWQTYGPLFRDLHSDAGWLCHRSHRTPPMNWRSRSRMIGQNPWRMSGKLKDMQEAAQVYTPPARINPCGRCWRKPTPTCWW